MTEDGGTMRECEGEDEIEADDAMPGMRMKIIPY
jgi:hypothetical protein